MRNVQQVAHFLHQIHFRNRGATLLKLLPLQFSFS